jgi:hypothetical protein
MKRLLASLLLISSLPVLAQVYTYTDAQGNPVFTNEPPPEGVNAQTVNVPPTNGAQVPAASNYTPPPPGSSAPPAQPASQQQTSGGSYADENDNADYDDNEYYGDDYERRRAAEAAAIDPRRNPVVDPVRVDTPAVDAAVPGPGHVEERARAR